MSAVQEKTVLDISETLIKLWLVLKQINETLERIEAHFRESKEE